MVLFIIYNNKFYVALDPFSDRSKIRSKCVWEITDTLSCAPCTTFCSYYILTPSVIYYWTGALQHGIYLFGVYGCMREVWRSRKKRKSCWSICLESIDACGKLEISKAALELLKAQWRVTLVLESPPPGSLEQVNDYNGTEYQSQWQRSMTHLPVKRKKINTMISV